MLILTLYFIIFFCPNNYLVFLLCLSILSEMKFILCSGCFQISSTFLCSSGSTSNICFVVKYDFHSRTIFLLAKILSKMGLTSWLFPFLGAFHLSEQVQLRRWLFLIFTRCKKFSMDTITSEARQNNAVHVEFYENLHKVLCQNLNIYLLLFY